jgi:hypothetical protein
MMSSDQTTVQRSWTETNESASGKWLGISLLGILLTVALVVLASLLWWKKEPRTFVTSIYVAEYDEQLLPQPAYSRWDLASWLSEFPTHGLSPWVEFGSQSPRNMRSEIDDSLSSLDENLQQERSSDRDTVVVYLRGHALVVNEQAYLLTSDFERSDIFQQPSADGQSRMVALESIFRQLQQLDAGNVILLADICDLSSSPKLGVIANDVPAMMDKALSEAEGEVPLWVISSTASLQTSHASFVRKRTLLQSACEYACDSKRSGSGKDYLSLSKFYDAVLRYSHHVSRGQQTPLLFRSGASGPIDDLDNQRWQEAGEVWIAETAPRPSTNNEQDAEEKPSAVAVGNRQADAVNPPSHKYVAIYQDAVAQNTTAQNTAAQNSATETGGEENESPRTTPQATANTLPESSPWLRFWQVREQLLDRNQNPVGWSPVDFAARYLRQMELDATRLERLHRLGSAEAERDMRASTLVLQELQNQLRNNGSTTSNARILEAWRLLQQQFSPESDKRPWSDPSDLPDAERARWLAVQQDYRIYFDSMSRLGAWLDKALREPSTRGVFLPKLEQLVSALEATQSDLPQDDSDAMLDHPVEQTHVDDIAEASLVLVRYEERQVTDMLRKVDTAANPNLKISWSDEHSLQQLLASTNITFADRKKLVTAYAALAENNLDEPGTNNNPLPTRDALSDLRKSGGSSRETLSQWCRLLQRALEMASSIQLQRVPVGSDRELNAWGHELLVAFQATAQSAPQGPTQRWNQSCLSDLDLFAEQSMKSNFGLIISVCKDNQLFVSVPPRVQLSSDARSRFDIGIKRQNGVKLSSCLLEWKVDRSAGTPGIPRTLLRSLAAAPLEAGQPNRVSVRNGIVSVQVETMEEGEAVESQIPILIKIADTEAGLEKAEWESIRIIPPNPDRVELYAKCLNTAAGDDGWVARTEKSFGTVLSGLRVPAVGYQAASRYEFYLSNRSDKAKTVIASIYPVSGSKNVGNGEIDEPAANKTRSEYARLPAILTTVAPIELPKNEAGVAQSIPDNRQPIVFKPLGETETPAGFGEFGLLCVIEEVQVIDSKVIKRPEVKPTFVWIECVPESLRQLVAIVPRDSEGAFEFDVSVTADNWKRYGIDELMIEGFVTDWYGGAVRCREPGSIVLKPDMPRQSLTLTPQDLTPARQAGPLVAHINVGGFPRARSFTSRLDGSNDVAGANHAFLWLEPSLLQCLSLPDGKPINMVQLSRDRLIVPARENSSDQSEGTEVKLMKLATTIKVDFPRDGLTTSDAMTVTFGGSRQQEYDSDRQFLPRFEVDGASLVFRAAASDLPYEISATQFEARGSKTLQVAVRGSPAKKSLDLVFDKTPPERAAVEVAPYELYKNERLQISIPATDADSAIDKVFFAIDQGGIDSGKYDPKDLLHTQAINVDNKWVGSLEANALQSPTFTLPAGIRTLVCRTIDVAGNVRDDNIGEEFSWKGMERPKEVAVVPAPEKPAPLKLHTVVVTITVDGGPPRYPENTDVSGVAGNPPAKAGATWVFTDVPEGPCEVTAIYKDKFDVEYVGKKKIVVPTQTRLTINARKKTD